MKKILYIKGKSLTLIFIIFVLSILFIIDITYAIIANILFLLIYMYITDKALFSNLSDDLKPKLNIKAFKIRTWFSIIILVFLPVLASLVGFVAYFFMSFTDLKALIISLSPLYLVFILNIFNMIFSAKLLVSIESGKLSKFSDYYKTLLLYFIFPFGLLSIHDRVRNIANIKKGNIS